MSGELKDLVVLTADKNIEGALRGLLSRPQSLGLREISYNSMSTRSEIQVAF